MADAQGGARVYEARVVSAALVALVALAAPPPVVSLVELTAGGKTVRVGHPEGWKGRREADGRSIRLLGGMGEGEMVIAAVTHPSELTVFLDRMKKEHAGSAPSPPSAIDVPGIDPQKGERATRFLVTGRELGELVMIERAGVIVLYATLVAPVLWKEVEAKLRRCYPTVEVVGAQKQGGR